MFQEQAVLKNHSSERKLYEYSFQKNLGYIEPLEMYL